MTGKSDTRKPEGKRPGERAERRATGFTRAGGLIGAQMDRVAARRGYLEARLAALWPEVVGPEVAAIAWPAKLTLSRGPAGGALALAVRGAHAPQVQMMAPGIIEKVNALLGPGAVRRVTLTQSARGLAPPARALPSGPRPAAAPRAPVPAEISNIGDDDLRRALETLARNVLSRNSS